MLELIDINTSNTVLEEVERLKREFKSYLSPTVSDGFVAIISSFPSFWNFTGIIDYIFIIKIAKKNGNYLRVNSSGRQNYVDSFIVVIKKISDDSILSADDYSVYSENASFNYIESLLTNNYEFQEYIGKYEKIKSCMLYSFSSENCESFINDKIFLNIELTARNITHAAVNNYISINPEQRVDAFNRESPVKMSNHFMIDFLNKILEDTNKKSIIGILTKKKLDRISFSSKISTDVYNNIGNTLSIISGKAGTGKTLTISRIIHKTLQNKNRVRYLTFNNLLVFDIKQILRNFSVYNDSNIAISTVHSFFYKLAKKLGIILILNEKRVDELLNICTVRLEKTRQSYYEYVNSNYNTYNHEEFFKCIIVKNNNKSDYQEFMEFSRYLYRIKVFKDFDSIKESYLEKKKAILFNQVGIKTFLNDYYKVIELIYLAISDAKKFYEDLNVKDRYELLAALYKIDTNKKEIDFDDLKNQVDSLKWTTNWSRFFIVDECQDFHVLEKEIIYSFKGSENVVVATGGKEQLIRRSEILDWSVSFGRKRPHQKFVLKGVSYRQKQNIVLFVNKFASLFGIDLNLENISESNGLGKVIIDTRPKKSLINIDTAKEMLTVGEVNGCTPYESLLVLIPSKNYTKKKKIENIVISETDYFKKVENFVDRSINNLDALNETGFFCWDGVSEEKSSLKVPFNNETRIIHYESCRGLEAWSCACMSIDDYFTFKRASDEAELHLASDLYYTEQERRDRYAALWCLMAFTRPIDTLYIHVNNVSDRFSKILLDLAKDSPGVIIY